MKNGRPPRMCAAALVTRSRILVTPSRILVTPSRGAAARSLPRCPLFHMRCSTPRTAAHYCTSRGALVFFSSLLSSHSPMADTESARWQEVRGAKLPGGTRQTDGARQSHA
jgi:hypothetical protein